MIGTKHTAISGDGQRPAFRFEPPAIQLASELGRCVESNSRRVGRGNTRRKEASVAKGNPAQKSLGGDDEVNSGGEAC